MCNGCAAGIFARRRDDEFMQTSCIYLKVLIYSCSRLWLERPLQRVLDRPSSAHGQVREKTMPRTARALLTETDDTVAPVSRTPSGRWARVPAHILQSTEHLPRAKDGPCYVQTRDGRRFTFASPDEMLKWARRTPDVTFICLDGCAWRTWDTFLWFLQRGHDLRSAFDHADLAGWSSTPGRAAELRRSQVG